MTFPRILAWAAAIVAILNAAVFALTPFVVDYPALGKVLMVITAITAVFTPFLPRAQGVPTEGN